MPDLYPVDQVIRHGWRAWDVKAQLPPNPLDVRLESVSHDYVWTPRDAGRAKCRKCGDNVPGDQCSCGFYSAKNLKHLMSMAYPKYDMECGHVRVLAELSLWGKIVEGSQGWRSEFAYPIRLFVPWEAYRLCKPLKQVYGVPAFLLNWLKDYDQIVIPGEK